MIMRKGYSTYGRGLALILLLFLACGVYAQHNDTIPEKKLFKSRYDRGIINHLLVLKKTWMCGADVSYTNYDSEDVQLLSLIKGFDSKLDLLSIHPFVGYFIRDNQSVGVRFGYNRIYANLANLQIDIDDDMSFSLANIAFKQELLSAAVFHRSYIGFGASKRFGLFQETSLSFNTGTSNYDRPISEEIKSTKTRIREIHLGLNPGVTAFITENVSAEVSFGVVGFKYREENQTVNGEESGWRKSSGANFKINLLNISIGIVAYL